jgi:hypothetical protein
MIFFGTKPVQKTLPAERQVCPNCMSVTDHTVIENDLRFTLYFIPLFSIRHEVIYTCGQCGDSHVVAYADYIATHTGPEPLEEPAKASAPSETKQAKARIILEGRVVGGEIHTARPWRATFNADNVLKWLYLGFAILGLVSVILLIILFTAAAR